MEYYGRIFVIFAGNVQNMLNFIKEYIRNRAIKDKKPLNKSVFLNMKEVRSVGFIYAVSAFTDMEELNKIVSGFTQWGIPFSGLVVEMKRGIFVKAGLGDGENIDHPISGADGVTFIENDYINWTGVPSSPKIDGFLKNQFDLFISFNHAVDFTLDYIVRSVEAKLIVGMRNSRYNTYSFVLEGENRTSLECAEFLEQVSHYLNIIKSSSDLQQLNG